MKVLLVHNYYKQSGGEDAVVDSEARLLREASHEVRLYTAHSDQIVGAAWRVAHRSIWSHSDYISIRQQIHDFNPDIVHVHNTFPLISTSVFKAVKSCRVALVHTLHNYRPFCLNGVLYRDGHVCTDCLGHTPLSGVLHKCYRGAYSQSAGAAFAGRFQIASGWLDDVDVFVTSSEFAKMINIKSGIPANKILVKPNPSFVAKQEVDLEFLPHRPTFLFVGRLDSRKGIKTVISAAQHVPYNIRIIGDGDLKEEIEKEISKNSLHNVKLLGWLSRDQVAAEMASATALIVASEFYESFGNVIIEAYSCGLPVISTDIGAQGTLVKNEITGLLYKAGDAKELASKMQQITDNVIQWKNMRHSVISEYNSKYSLEGNTQLLLEIYSEAKRRSVERYKC